MNNTTEWLKEIELQLNYVCYEKEMITKLQKVWEALINAQSKVEKLPIHGIINWAYFNDEKPNYGDQLLIQDPPEQMTIPRVEIYDRDTTWIDGSRYAVITPCL